MRQKKEYTLAELTKNLEIEIKGDPQCIIKGVGTIQQAEAGQITFLVNPLYKKYLPTTQASAVILNPGDAEECPVNAVISRNPYFTYAKVAAFFDQKSTPASGIHPTAVIGADCQIDKSASIGANCVIGEGVKIAANVIIAPGCVIGDDTEIDVGTCLDANVTLYHQIIVGKHVVISSGCVIGSDGFGIAKHKGEWHKVPQLGRVVIGDYVEIGSNCSIDRGAIDDTVIEKGVKLDNLIQIGHNVRIGENTAIAGCVGIAGSAVIGKNCLIGGCAGINGHITIADNVVITGMTVVSKSIREPGIYSSGVGGLVTNLEWRKNSARLHRLDQLTKRVKNLEDLTLERKVT
jgi:UDP-3-O-[3-hydroxymyristoyl] glucosamine N-acyltransferase